MAPESFDLQRNISRERYSTAADNPPSHYTTGIAVRQAAATDKSEFRKPMLSTNVSRFRNGCITHCWLALKCGQADPVPCVEDLTALSLVPAQARYSNQCHAELSWGKKGLKTIGHGNGSLFGTGQALPHMQDSEGL